MTELDELVGGISVKLEIVGGQSDHIRAEFRQHGKQIGKGAVLFFNPSIKYKIHSYFPLNDPFYEDEVWVKVFRDALELTINKEIEQLRKLLPRVLST